MREIIDKLYLRLSDCDGMCNLCTGKLNEICRKYKDVEPKQ